MSSSNYTKSFFFGVGSHLSLSKNCLEIMLHFWESADSYKVKGYEKIQKNIFNLGGTCAILWSIRLDQYGYHSGPPGWTLTAQLQPSLTHFSLIPVKDLGK